MFRFLSFSVLIKFVDKPKSLLNRPDNYYNKYLRITSNYFSGNAHKQCLICIQSNLASLS
jgi:hypothetical protein